MTDPVADCLTRLRNAAKAQHHDVTIPSSKLKRGLARSLKEQGYITDFSVEPGRIGEVIKVRLRYTEDRSPVISGMDRISRPGRRRYVPNKEIPRVLGGMGTAIVSTSSGVMTGAIGDAGTDLGDLFFRIHARGMRPRPPLARCDEILVEPLLLVGPADDPIGLDAGHARLERGSDDTVVARLARLAEDACDLGVAEVFLLDRLAVLVERGELAVHEHRRRDVPDEVGQDRPDQRRRAADWQRAEPVEHALLDVGIEVLAQRDARHRDEPHRRALGHRRGRPGRGALRQRSERPLAAQRRARRRAEPIAARVREWPLAPEAARPLAKLVAPCRRVPARRRRLACADSPPRTRQ